MPVSSAGVRWGLSVVAALFIAVTAPAAVAF
jgi:hypothetical protein